MAGRHSRNKGASEERAVVNFHKQMGIHARRTLTSGARNDGEETFDLDIFWKGVDEAPLIGECKVRGTGFTQIYRWLGDNDFLTIRTDRRDRLYVMHEGLWIKLIGRAS